MALDTEAKKVPGYLQTIPFNLPDEAIFGGFITHVPLVIAKSFPSAMRAAQSVKVDWDLENTSDLSSKDIEEEARNLLSDSRNAEVYWKVGDYNTSKDKN